MKRLLCLCVFVLSAAAQADHSPAKTAVSAETQKQIDTQQEHRAPSASTGRQDQQKRSSEPLKRFVPKERIPAGSAISFPTDI